MMRNRKAAVLGSPIAHSLSPVLHTAAYRALGLSGWTYTRHEVAEEELPGFVAGLEGDWAGLSLTMPLKQAALQVVDEVEPLAEVVGAINTILFAPGGLKVGANTDVYGIVAALADASGDDASGQAPAPPRRGVIVGGGATAASAIAALGQLGITDPVLIVRSLARSGAVIRAATAMGVLAQYLTLGTPQATAAINEADILISTIPAAGSNALARYLGEELRAHQTLLDVVYQGWPTPLPTAWAQRGGTVAPGYDMLLHQAAEQVRLMTGADAPVDVMRTELLAALNLS